MASMSFEADSKLDGGKSDPLPLRLLRPFVDWVAQRQMSVHIKLLVGFLLIALLLKADVEQ